MRQSRASCSAVTRSGGISRVASIRPAAAAMTGASARALAMQSTRARSSIFTPPLGHYGFIRPVFFTRPAGGGLLGLDLGPELAAMRHNDAPDLTANHGET